MPKMKSNRAAGKRFKLSGSGKVVRYSAGKRHGMIDKRRSRKRRLLGSRLVDPADQPRMQRLLGQR
jgi:large subunit ribosomal protein L35